MDMPSRLLLTAGQREGLQMAKRLAKAKRHQVAVLSGPAGSGKTTLLKIIAEELGNPIIICPTGKAAARVTQATGLASLTCHRWLYKPIFNDKTGETEFLRLPPDQVEIGEAGILVIDEASMVTRTVWEDIRDAAEILDLKVLCVGDSFQLPPVDEKDEDFSLLDPKSGVAGEYVVLCEILRQAQESPIIRASIAVRNGDIQEALSILSPLVPPKKFIERGGQIQAKGGAVLCHRNATRLWTNLEIRKDRGFSSDDVRAGEPVLILKNSYPLNVFNGETYEFGGFEELSFGRHTVYDRWNKIREESKFGLAVLRDSTRKMEVKGVLAQEELLGRMKASTSAIDATARILHRGVPPLHGNLGYALSFWKSQGSEWDEVLIAWEPTLKFFGKYKDESLRAVYTAITRARTKCQICFGIAAPANI